MYSINLTRACVCECVIERKKYEENNDKIQKPRKAVLRARSHTINCISEKHMPMPPLIGRLTTQKMTHTNAPEGMTNFPPFQINSSQLHDMALRWAEQKNVYAQIEIINARTYHFRWHLSYSVRVAPVFSKYLPPHTSPHVRMGLHQVNNTITRFRKIVLFTVEYLIFYVFDSNRTPGARIPGNIS